MTATITKTVSCTGIGIHSGAPVTMTIRPAPAGHGIEFIRTDIPGNNHIKVAPENFSGEERGTKLGSGQVFVQTVEHLLATISMLGLDDLIIEVNSSEIPILDGSAQPLIELYQQAGIKEEKSDRTPLVILEPIIVPGDKGAFLAALPAKRFDISVIADFPAPVGVQVYSSSSTKALLPAYAGALRAGRRNGTFVNDIAPARTFGWMQELGYLRSKGLGKGASMENAIGISADGYSTPLRFPDEIVRHKVLDLIGDLAGLRKPLKANIIGYRTSHSLNIQFMKKLAGL